MTTILLDDTLIQDVLEDRKGRALLLKRLLEDGHLLACCAPTVAEIHSRGRPARRSSVLLDSLEYLPVTLEVAKLAGQFRRVAIRRHQSLTPDDAIAGAIAVANRCSLLSDRPGRYPIETLSLYPAIPRPKRN